MITVRFPTGFSIQYNDANYVQRSVEYSEIYHKQGDVKVWVAQVPNGCIIEMKKPCHTYNAIGTDSDKVQAEVSLLSMSVRSMQRKLNKIAMLATKEGK